MKLPKEVPHRTYSGNGRRRISLQLAPIDPRCESLDWVNDVTPFERLELDGLRIEPGPKVTGVNLEGMHVETNSSFLMRGARAIVAYGGHLGHNEFDAGFIVSDVLSEDEDVVLFKIADRELRVPGEQAVGLLKGIIARLEAAAPPAAGVHTEPNRA
jgi:hypothetical protein